MTPLEAAWQDFDQAQAAYKADPCESNRLAYLAATNATHALVVKEATKPRACFFCGKVLMAAGGFVETTTQPDGTRRDFCSWRCIRDQLKDGAAAMRNVNIAVDGTVLTVTIKLDERGQPSMSGKTLVIASTEGAAEVPGSDLRLNINLWRRVTR